MNFETNTTVTIGGYTKKSDHEKVGDNTQFLQQKGDVGHDLDPTTGDGKHKAGFVAEAPSVVLTAESAWRIIFVDLDDPNQVWDYKAFMGAVKASSWVAELGPPPVHGAMWIDHAKDSIIWWDLEANVQYMAFETVSAGGDLFGPASLVVLQDIYFLDGKIYSCSDATAGGVYIADLVADEGWRFLSAGNGLMKYKGNISERNDGLGWNILRPTGATVDTLDNDCDPPINAARHPSLVDEFGRPKHYWSSTMRTHGWTTYFPAENDADAALWDGIPNSGTPECNIVNVNSNGLAIFTHYNGGGTVNVMGWRNITNITADWTFTRTGNNDRNSEDFNFMGGATITNHDLLFRHAGTGEGLFSAVYMGQLIKGRECYVMRGAYGAMIFFIDVVNPSKSGVMQIDEEGNHPYCKGGFHSSGTAGTVACYSLENLTDYSGRGNNLTNNNTVLFTSGGVLGNAPTFDGSNQSLSRTGDTDFNMGTGDWSVSLWFKSTSASNPAGLELVCYLVDSIGSDVIDLRFLTDGSFRARLSDDGMSTNDEINTGSVDLYDARWHNCVFQRSGSTLSLYIDGVQVGAITIVQAAASIDPDEIWIGSNRVGTEAFAGRVDQVVVSKLPLDWEEIQYNYQRGLRAQEVAINNDFLPELYMQEIAGDPDSGYWVAAIDGGQVIVFDRHCIPIASDAVPSGTLNCVAIKQFVGQRGGYSLLLGGSSDVEFVQADLVITDGGR